MGKSGRVTVGAEVWLMAAALCWENVKSRGSWGELLVVPLAILIHELGHWGAAKVCGVGVKGLRVGLFGAQMELEGLFSYGSEWLIAAAGPMANFLSGALVFPLWWRYGGTAVGAFVMASGVLGCLNLLPVGQMDGGRMLYCLMASAAGERVAEGIRRWCTRLFLGGMWLLAGYALLTTQRMLPLYVFALGLMLGKNRAGSSTLSKRLDKKGEI